MLIVLAFATILALSQLPAPPEYLCHQTMLPVACFASPIASCGSKKVPRGAAGLDIPGRFYGRSERSDGGGVHPPACFDMKSRSPKRRVKTFRPAIPVSLLLFGSLHTPPPAKSQAHTRPWWETPARHDYSANWWRSLSVEQQTEEVMIISASVNRAWIWASQQQQSLALKAAEELLPGRFPPGTKPQFVERMNQNIGPPVYRLPARAYVDAISRYYAIKPARHGDVITLVLCLSGPVVITGCDPVLYQGLPR